jgi:hypothetical protein
MITRRHVVRSCKQRGWTIQPGALRGILELAETEDEVELILDQIGLLQGGSGVVTDDVWAELVEAEADPPHPPPRGVHGKGFAGGSSRGGGGRANDAAARKGGTGLIAGAAGDRDSSSSWSVVNAFETPKLVYEAMRKQFYVEEKRYSLFGTAQDKVRGGGEGMSLCSRCRGPVFGLFLDHDPYDGINIFHKLTSPFLSWCRRCFPSRRPTLASFPPFFRPT